jgi:hypothetical protein
MSTIQQAIAKTVEVATTDSLIIDTTASDQTINPSGTLFANMFAVGEDIHDQITLSDCALGWSGTALSSFLGISSAYNNRFYVTATTATTGTLVDITGTIATKLGFTGSETPVTSGSLNLIFATYQPEEVWFPTYVNGDTNWFDQLPADRFKGTEGSDGNISGVNYTARDRATKNWEYEFSYNAIPYADDTGDSAAIVAARAVRSFSQVLGDAASMSLAQSGSGVACPVWERQ